MSARGAYRLTHTRGGVGPAVLAAPDRTDRVEVVELSSGEVVLFWEGPPREASRLAKALRADLAALEPDAFAEAWLHEGREGS